MVQAGQLIFLEPSTSTFSIPLAKALLELDKWKTMLMVLQSDSPSRVVVLCLGVPLVGIILYRGYGSM